MSARRKERRERERAVRDHGTGRDLPPELQPLAAAFTATIDREDMGDWQFPCFFVANMHPSGLAMLEARELADGFAWLEATSPELLPEARAADKIRRENGADSIVLLLAGRTRRFAAFVARPAPTSGVRINSRGSAVPS